MLVTTRVDALEELRRVGLRCSWQQTCSQLHEWSRPSSGHTGPNSSSSSLRKRWLGVRCGLLWIPGTNLSRLLTAAEWWQFCGMHTVVLFRAHVLPVKGGTGSVSAIDVAQCTEQEGDP